jgi:putative heme-binding domain-containing protein
MHKVTRHILRPHGATFESQDEDFLVSDNLDFHPTDVLEDADGSLIVVDTGGWYKLCCPSSQLHKPDVLGAIYRVRKKDAQRIEDPRGLKLAWTQLTADQLAHLLDDSRPAVRKRAVQALADKGARAVKALTNVLEHASSSQARCDAVWAVTRIDSTEARAAVRRALGDSDETVRQAAIHSVSVWRDPAAVAQLTRLLKGPSAQNQRAAAEALGRIGDRSAVPELLSAIGRLSTPTNAERADTSQGSAYRVLEHSLIYALIEIADPEGVTTGLASGNPLIVQAALISLDQMESGAREVQSVARHLTSHEPRLREIATWIVGRHPEWGNELASFYRNRLATSDLAASELENLGRQLGRLARAPAIQTLLAERLCDPAATPAIRRLVLDAMAQSGVKETPTAWSAALGRVLTSSDMEQVRAAAGTVRALPAAKKPPHDLLDALLAAGRNGSAPVDVRLTALAAIPGGLAEINPAIFELLRASVNREQPAGIRALAADILSRAHLSADQLLVLTKVFQSVGPIETDRVLEAFAQCADEVVGRALISALTATAVRASLRTDTLRPRLAKFGAPVQALARELYAALDADNATQRQRLEQLVSIVATGDIRRGQAIFNSSKAACVSCHAVGYLGGHIGPDLTRIGSIRSERDLLEAIVFPSASLVRSYEPVAVTTKTGKLYNGLVRRDTADEMVLVLAADQEVRIPRKEIDDVQPSKISIMPAGFDQQLTPRELADLVTFLKACK